jgi:glycerol-3-phosphate acyltransferase PlsY
VEVLIYIIISYLVGSVPFAWIIAKTHNIDLRKVGSGNIGATNLSRALGKKWGYFCFGLDVLKGFVPIFIVSRFILGTGEVSQLFGALGVGAASIVGHIYPIYLKFKGGKGVATSFGVALGLWPYYTICAIFAVAVWTIVVLVSKYVSLASIFASVTFCAAMFISVLIVPGRDYKKLWPLLVVSVMIAALVIFMHRTNIKRLIAGTENKIGRKSGS